MASDLNQLLPPAPIQTPVLGPGGLVSPAWVLYFQKLNQRVGGGSSQTVTQNTTGIVAAQGDITILQGDVALVEGEITTLNADVSTLSAEQTSQGASIVSIEATLAPGISATVTTAALTTGGTEGSMTFTHGILTAQVQAT